MSFAVSCLSVCLSPSLPQLSHMYISGYGLNRAVPKILSFSFNVYLFDFAFLSDEQFFVCACISLEKIRDGFVRWPLTLNGFIVCSDRERDWLVLLAV